MDSLGLGGIGIYHSISGAMKLEETTFGYIVRGYIWS